MGVKFGDLSFYSGGFVLPEGDYALQFDVRMHAFTKGDGTKGQEKLGVMVKAHHFDGSDPAEQFYSLGTKAHLSFAPDPEMIGADGFCKGLAAIPNGPAGTLPQNTNWQVLLKSLYDCGMPEGTFSDDFSTIDGIWVHMQPTPEPEGRKSFGAKTGEAATEQQNQGPSMIAVVTEIKDDGKPWEGGGGIPEAQEAAPAPKAKVVARPGPKAVAPKAAAPKAAAPAARPGPKAVAPKVNGTAVAASGDEAVMDAALSGIGSVLEKNPAGVTRLLLRMGTFKAATASHGDETAQAVLDNFFVNDEALDSVLGQHGYTLKGTQVVPRA